MTWFNAARSRDDVLAVIPEYQAGFNALYKTLWHLKEIPATTLELCRLRIAQLHRSETEWLRQEVSVTASRRDTLTEWHLSKLFDPGERACLALAEVYAMDPQAITDEHADAVKLVYGEPGLVALVEALGLFYGLTRLSQLWELPADAMEEGDQS